MADLHLNIVLVPVEKGSKTMLTYGCVMPMEVHNPGPDVAACQCCVLGGQGETLGELHERAMDKAIKQTGGKA